MPHNSAQAPTSPVIVKADTGASRHYFKPSDAHVLRQIKRVANGPSVLLPNGDTLQATQKALIPINDTLSVQAQQTYIFPGLENASLLSIGQLCDDGCQALFDNNYLHVFKNSHLILRGFRNTQDGLWDVSFGPTAPTKSTYHLVVNAIIRRDKPKTDLANFFHGCLFSPALVTLQKAIAHNHLLTWPGINQLNFPKLVTDTTNTDMGHLTQERQNLQSTKHVLPYR